MKTDPNRHCIKFKQDTKWAIVHDFIAHPLMALTFYSRWSIIFHNWTSHKAWEREENEKQFSSSMFKR